MIGNSRGIDPLVPNFMAAARTAAKVRKYHSKKIGLAANAQYSVTGNPIEFVNSINKSVLESGQRNGGPESQPKDTEFLQARQQYALGKKRINRWDMINPYWLTAQGPYGNDGTALELMVNKQANPLPFANDNFDQIEAQALDERFESYKNPQSARFALYNIHPELGKIEEEYLNGNTRYKKSAKIEYTITRPMDSSDRYGQQNHHKPTREDAPGKIYETYRDKDFTTNTPPIPALLANPTHVLPRSSLIPRPASVRHASGSALGVGKKKSTSEIKDFNLRTRVFTPEVVDTDISGSSTAVTEQVTYSDVRRTKHHITGAESPISRISSYDPNDPNDVGTTPLQPILFNYEERRKKGKIPSLIKKVPVETVTPKKAASTTGFTVLDNVFGFSPTITTGPTVHEGFDQNNFD